MSRPVFLEEWVVTNDPRLKPMVRCADCDVCIGREASDAGPHVCIASVAGGSEVQLEERAKLVAAAPALVRVLLRLEWQVNGDMGHRFCPLCGRSEGLEHRAEWNTSPCSIDEALTAAGFPDAKSRSSAREYLEGG